MAKKASEVFSENNRSVSEDAKRELRRNIIVGSILRSLHKQQGTMPYLVQMVEPYLKKSDRQLFGLLF